MTPTIVDHPASPAGRSRVDVGLASAAFLLLSGPTFAPADDYSRLSFITVAFIVIFFVRSGQRVQNRSYASGLLGFFAAWCLLSSAWSIQPATSLAAGATLVLLVCLAGMTRRLLDVRGLLWALVLATVVAAGLSLALWAVNPSQALVAEAYQAGSLKGIYAHRNHLAYVCTLGLAGVGALYNFKGGRRLWLLAPAAILTTSLILASSATATLLSAVGVALAVSLAFIGRAPATYRGFALFTAISLAMAVMIVGATQVDRLLGVLGRDITLTGRTFIWQSVIGLWNQQPWLGYGWGATWSEESVIRGTVQGQVRFAVFHSHNGYLDVLLQVGVIGLILLALPLTSVILNAIGAFLGDVRHQAAAIAVIVIPLVILGYSVAESRLFQPLGFVLLTALSGYVWERNSSPESRRRARRAQSSTPVARY